MNQPQVYIYPLLLGFHSHLGHQRELNRAPYVIQLVLCIDISILHISSVFNVNSVYMSISVSQSAPSPDYSPWYPYVCSLHLCLCFTFASKFIYTIFSGIHICVLMYNICFLLFLTCFTLWQSRGPSMSLQMALLHSFSWLSHISLYTCITSSLSIHLLIDI